jgi:hypothetical protein
MDGDALIGRLAPCSADAWSVRRPLESWPRYPECQAFPVPAWVGGISRDTSVAKGKLRRTNSSLFAALDGLHPPRAVAADSANPSASNLSYLVRAAPRRAGRCGPAAGRRAASGSGRRRSEPESYGWSRMSTQPTSERQARSRRMAKTGDCVPEQPRHNFERATFTWLSPARW